MHLDDTLWRTLCERYNLGRPLQTPQVVSGGMQHRLYRAQAASGTYAVKELHPDLLREPGRRAHYERAEQLARRMAESGIPAVCALDSPDGPLLSLGDSTVAVFPWRDGATLPPSPSSPAAAGRIGGLLGRIHALAPDVSGTIEAGNGEHAEEEWAGLAAQGRQAETAWAEPVMEALGEIVRWSREAHLARKTLGHVLWTHRDLDQKNVLWSDADTPWLLDWEGAGPLPPALEVVGTALNWAGQAAGTPERAPFLAFVRGYQAVRAVSADDLQQAAQAVPDKWLVWLKLNLRRSTGLREAQRAGDRAAASEYEMACGAALHSLGTLRALDREAGMRAAWCKEA